MAAPNTGSSFQTVASQTLQTLPLRSRTGRSRSASTKSASFCLPALSCGVWVAAAMMAFQACQSWASISEVALDCMKRSSVGPQKESSAVPRGCGLLERCVVRDLYSAECLIVWSGSMLGPPIVVVLAGCSVAS